MGSHISVGAVIAEFNPFHNGHKYLLERIKKDNDAAAAIMSGNFVQRGDIAVFDKFTRAKAAISAGFDLVIELPAEYAVNGAEMFAYGGVCTAEKTGCINSLYFGSECADIVKITKAANCILSENTEQSAMLKSLLKEGYGYAAAYDKVFSEMTDADILAKPNNILGLEYVKALIRLKSSIIPHTFARINVQHNSAETKDGYASASLIRDMIYKRQDFSAFIPPECADIFHNAHIADKRALDTMLLYVIRILGKDYLKNINGVSEGIENRIFECAKREYTLDGIADKVCTKRYSKARVRRILISALLGIEKTVCTEPRYIRVLAMNKKGAEILSVMKKTASLPVITKAADFKKELSLENRAADIFSICASLPSGMEFTSRIFADV